MEYIDDVSFSKIDGGVVLISNSLRDGQDSTLFKWHSSNFSQGSQMSKWVFLSISKLVQLQEFSLKNYPICTFVEKKMYLCHNFIRQWWWICLLLWKWATWPLLLFKSKVLHLSDLRMRAYWSSIHNEWCQKSCDI